MAPEDLFRNALCLFARENLTEWVASLSDEELRWRITSGIARARSHGFQWQHSIATFVSLMLRFAPNFDQYPPIRAVLGEAAADAEGRADQLLTEVSAEQWQEAQNRYDPGAWYEFP